MKRYFAAAICVAFAWTVLVRPASAQDFPNHPLKIIQGFAPGGNADIIARVLAQEMAKGLGQPVVVEARVGAGGNIAAEVVSKAAPDGYTLLLVTGGHAVSGVLYKSLPYDPVESFEMVGLITQFQFLILTRADSRLQTMGALLEQARVKPGSVTYGSAGVGSTQHLNGELIGSMAKVQLLHVPYKGDAAALTGLLGGEVDFIVAPPTVALGQLKSGRVTVLATTGNTRWAGLPNAPTLVESGVQGFDVRSWAGLVAPAGTPKPIIERLNAEMQRLAQVPEVRAKLEELGGEVRASTPAEMKAKVAGDLQRWNKVVKEAKIPQQ
jgi:tripartite-type tricarboxylate transporter receptor subunit TctC